MKYQELDYKAKSIAKRYKACEKDLLEIIILLDQKKTFRYWGYESLFAYVSKGLGLSNAVTYNFIAVARKAREVPELKAQVLSGKLSIHQARKITSVVTPENQKIWLERASTQTQRQLEKEVALANPKMAIVEKSNYVSSDREIKEKVKVLTTVSRVQLQMGVSERTMFQLKRAQDLVIQKRKRNVSLEETLDALLECYLKKNDPIEKAKRQKMRGKLDKKGLSETEDSNASACENLSQDELKMKTVNTLEETSVESKKIERKAVPSLKRKPIPAKIRHQVHLRDQGRCTFKDNQGLRCFSRRFLEIHHHLEVVNGGDNSLENLTTLCSGHHKAHHLSSHSP